MSNTAQVIGITGFKNSGKTTLVEKLVSEFTARGLSVSTIKHAHHTFDIDHKGRDSYRHRKAGAREVAVISRNQWAIIRDMNEEPEPPLAEILARLHPCDLVIVEGYKRDSHPKIEARNIELDHPELAGEDKTVIAIAASGPVADAPVPVFCRDDIKAMADFALQHLEHSAK
ncbi:MAG: molybdopterin-guanine dinucleotide biosynthesis protein B [Rhizobiales bacterium]|nr:molybdopterin-guanine dinucleotide biosynthesis protein B [Hyphomicrobiales bacterium]